ncbi:CDP-alcohol phosphatidyltransferase family protein [Patescibacteria group bacterium]|nr:CDP-alcohol phosphatidyltransferase family protein [Patescibacteria group bacterium]MBU4162124.1 CDP-alcohol phosphatidyltransferase family protein [Patescibacteria group bacterium]
MFNDCFSTIKRWTIAETRIRDDFLIKFLGFVPYWLRPNHITAIRFSFSWLLYFPKIVGTGLVLFLIIAGFLGDLIDGSLARKRNQITNFGKVFDPVADKVLAVGVLWYLFSKSIIAPNLILHIVLPEILLVIYGLWILLDRRVKLPEPNILGRIKFLFYLSGFTVLTISQLRGADGISLYLGFSLIITGIFLSWLSQIVYAQDVIGDFLVRIREKKSQN